jgi:hypothetical protein
METLQRSDLPTLVEDHGEDYAVSIYLTPQVGADSRQNPVRLKNLLRSAEEKLLSMGMRSADAQQLLAPAINLVEPAADWGQFGRGIAVFAGQTGIHCFNVPNSCRERCEVAKTFYVMPLVQSLAEQRSYYVLAVSQNQVRLLHGIQNEMHEVEVAGLPLDRASSVLLEDREKTLQAHLGQSQVPGRGDLMYHGHGGAPDASKHEIAEFLRAIDRVVAKYLRDKTEPLLFAGVEFLFPKYQQANTYPRLLPTSITGNPELWSLDEFRQKAWPLVEPLIESRRLEELARYGNLISQERTADRLEDILVAADLGAIETLFVDPSVERRGVFTAGTSTVRIDDPPRPESEDLINLAAVLVLRSSGTVEPLASSDIPGDDEIAAILRYPFAVGSALAQ